MRSPCLLANFGGVELRGLVNELDEKLAPAREVARIEDLERVAEQRSVRPWLGIAAACLVLVAAMTLVVRPWQDSCLYAADVCEVAELDIDALRVAIPNSDVIAALPNIDALDPNDELTAGDIFAMERFAHINFEDLLTPGDIEVLLGG